MTIKGLLASAKASQDFREYDLDNWVNDFERGFPKHTKWSPDLRENFWGRKPENRPKIRELNQEDDAKYNEGYRLAEVFPDRDNENLSWLLFGTPSEIRIALNVLMNLHLRDNSTPFVGFPLNDWIRRASVTRVSVQLVMYPGRFGSRNYERRNYWGPRQITIPYCDRRKLNYKAVRDACGGVNGINWGEWSATATLKAPGKIGTIHQMKARGRSEADATANLNRFLKFTRCELRNLSHNKLDYSTGERAKDADREERRNLKVYPSSIFVLNQDTIDALLVKRGEDGKPTHTGKQISGRFARDIYDVKEPSDWNDWVQDAYRDTQGRLID